MTKSLFSPSWYRVGSLKPRLRAHAQIHRQSFRGDVWYIVQDHQTGQFHRLSPAAHSMVCLMDGRRTVEDIWQLVGDRLGDDQPTQDETIRLLAQLHAADLLVGEVPPDMDELARRSGKREQQSLLLKLRNPLALRLPLFDPDRFLTATLPLVRPLFTLGAFLVWLVIVIAGAILAAVHWPELTGNLNDRVLTADNVALILVIYPVIKVIHELGHAYATKVWGGEVHETGLMFLVLVPVPYVDASASLAFREKWRRAVVGGAGIMVELALAGLAMIAWVWLEPGLPRAIAFNVMLIGGVSTLLFNGNPLLRFDGYYVLCDLVEIPNLGTRANRYVFYLVQRYLFGVVDATSPVTARGESAWFVGYAVGAFVYRIVIMVGIALFIATKLFFVGIGLAAWVVFSSLVMPLLKGSVYLLTSVQLRRRRARAIAISAMAAAMANAAVFIVPLPYATVAQGIVWLPDEASVRAQTEGIVVAVVAPIDARVAPLATLFTLDDPALESRTAVLEKQLEELQLRLDTVRTTDLVQANIFREQIRHAQAALDVNRSRASQLSIVAEKAGRFIVPEGPDLPGRFVKQGDVLGYVVGDDDPVVRVVVTQADVDLVRRATHKVEVRFAERVDRAVPATVAREVPVALADLPSAALAVSGGGEIALDPSKPNTPQSLETLFQFDVRVPLGAASGVTGGRVYVRFDHGIEPMAWRVMRALRQLFLKQFNV